MYIKEGQGKFKVGKSFYRSESQVVRDLGVLAAFVYQQENQQLRVLDAMSSSGVRSLRYWLESQASFIWSNEGNPDLGENLRENLGEVLAAKQGKITQKNALDCLLECHLHRDYYDLVDLDCFGSASPFVSASLWGVKLNGLLYLTSTDGKTATGKLPENSLKAYGAYGRSHPAAQEQGLRLLLGALQQESATRGLGIVPIFSFFSGQTYRVMVRLVHYQCLTAENYGFLGYCHECGNYQTISWQKLGRTFCNFDKLPLTFSGPLWLGTLGDPVFLGKMKQRAMELNWPSRVNLIEILQNEGDFPPYFYTLRELGRRGKMDLPRREKLLEILQKNGFKATITHINPEAIKTDADFNSCLQLTRDN